MTQIQGEATTTNQPLSIASSPLLVSDGNSMNRIMLSHYIAKQRPRLRDQEVDYLQQVGRVTAAIKANSFQTESLKRARVDKEDGILENAANKLDNEA